MSKTGHRSDFKTILKTYRRLLTYSGTYWLVGVLAMLGMLIDAGGLTAFSAMIKSMVNDLFPRPDISLLHWMLGGILTIAILRGIGSYASDFGMAYISRHVVQTMRKNVFDAYLRLPNEFFAKEASGHQISRIAYTCEQVAQASTNAVKVLITDGATVLGMLGVMLWNSAYLTLALLVMLPTLALVVTVISRRYRRYSKRIQGNMGNVASSVSEAIGGRREIRIYGGQGKESERFDRVSQLTARLELKIASTGAISSAGMQMTAAIALAAIILLATRPAMLAGGHMTSGTFMAVLMAMAGLLAPLKRLAGVQSTIQSGVVAADELFRIMDTPSEPDQGRHELLRAEGEIVFRHVDLTYPGADHPAIDKLDLICPRGKVTALVGRSGSGKSTLVSLLPRFSVPDQGEVLLDGVPLEEYTLASLRRQIAWVGQHVMLFDDTVAANIAYGELAGASEERIVAAAEAANAMEFIRNLPQGLQTPIGEGGHLLSGGQRQRIAIARAILKDAPILILDEATSALDTESERLIQQALQRLIKDRTTLVIAHRLSTIEGADQIVVMEQGKVIEQGTHGELMQHDGRYAMLYQMQFSEQAAGGD